PRVAGPGGAYRRAGQERRFPARAPQYRGRIRRLRRAAPAARSQGGALSHRAGGLAQHREARARPVGGGADGLRRARGSPRHPRRRRRLRPDRLVPRPPRPQVDARTRRPPRRRPRNHQRPRRRHPGARAPPEPL
ncbi:MAG: hypothetical protein AVDCRST_MAG88-4233, partial [uncultured Thermomicrobiales bacterium]